MAGLFRARRWLRTNERQLSSRFTNLAKCLVSGYRGHHVCQTRCTWQKSCDLETIVLLVTTRPSVAASAGTMQYRNRIIFETLTGYVNALPTPASRGPAAASEEVRCVDFCQLQFLIAYRQGRVTVDVSTPLTLRLDTVKTAQLLQAGCPCAVTVSVEGDRTLRLAWILEGGEASVATVEWISSIRCCSL